MIIDLIIMIINLYTGTLLNSRRHIFNLKDKKNEKKKRIVLNFSLLNIENISQLN